jgi:hypothetical protein
MRIWGELESLIETSRTEYEIVNSISGTLYKCGVFSSVLDAFAFNIPRIKGKLNEFGHHFLTNFIKLNLF